MNAVAEPGEEPGTDWGAPEGYDWEEELKLVEAKKTVEYMRENSGEKKIGEVMQVDGSLEPDWRREFKDHYKIRATYDTGATTSIFTEDMIPGMEVYQTQHTGKEFVVANGAGVKNQGEAKLPCEATNGTKVNLKGQVARITRPLVASNDVVDAPGPDNWVVMNRKGGYIWNEGTGKTVPIFRNGRRWDIELKVMKPEAKNVEWNNWPKTFKPKVCTNVGQNLQHPQGGSYQSHNNFDALKDDTWALRFVGQDKHWD